MTFAERVRAQVEDRFSPDGMTPYDPCHDAFHVGRVARNAVLLARLEGADVDVCETAAWLHDLDRAGVADPVWEAGAILAKLGAPSDFSSRVLEAVVRHKEKSFAPGGKGVMSLEAQVLGDADKLEAIGAIGIARAFSFGGFKGRPLWDGAPTEVPEVYVSGSGGSTVQHFYDKLLRLQADFGTASGRRLGAERTAFLRVFLDQFFAEWNAAEG